VSLGRAVLERVSRRPVTPYARVLSHGGESGIYDVQDGAGASASASTSVFLSRLLFKQCLPLIPPPH
jgi:hypothetical protein